MTIAIHSSNEKYDLESVPTKVSEGWHGYWIAMDLRKRAGLSRPAFPFLDDCKSDNLKKEWISGAVDGLEPRPPA